MGNQRPKMPTSLVILIVCYVISIALNFYSGATYGGVIAS